MLISQSEAERRINNPLNLLTKLRSGLKPKARSAMDLFVRPASEEQDKQNELKSQVVVQEVCQVTTQVEVPTFNPFPDSATEQTEISINSPSVSELMGDDIDADIELAKTHNKALKLMSTAMDTLGANIDHIKKDKLPTVISSLGRVVTDIRKERSEREKNQRQGENVHYHFYCPTQRKVDEYKVIEVA